MSTLEGQAALQRRLRAVADGRTLLQTVQLKAVAEAKRLHAPNRKTGHTSRTIMPGGSGPGFTIVQAQGAAVFLEFGTKPHTIRPRKASVLSWTANKRLSGRARTNGGRRFFAKVVRHPGTKPQPFLVPGAIAALDAVGSKSIVDSWNRAA